MYESNNINNGKVIACWGPIHRQCGISTTAALLASYISLSLPKNSDEKVLVMTNELSMNAQASTYLTSELIPDGISEICSLSRSGNLKTVKDIENNTFSGLPRIDIVGPTFKSQTLKDELADEVKNIFDKARSGYNTIVVDTAASVFNSHSRAILEAADIIVVCLPQDKYTLSLWVHKSKDIYNPIVEIKPTVYVSGIHYEFDHLSYAIISKSLKRDMFYISMNEVISYGVNERCMLETVSKHMTLASKNKKDADDVVVEIAAIHNQIIHELKEAELLKARSELEREKLDREEAQGYLERLKNAKEESLSNIIDNSYLFGEALTSDLETLDEDSDGGLSIGDEYTNTVNSKDNQIIYEDEEDSISIGDEDEEIGLSIADDVEELEVITDDDDEIPEFDENDEEI